MNLYLSGIIGSGKTTIGEVLAQRLGLAFRDLDHEMNARLGYSFHRLVAEQGWLPFRELEYRIVKDFVATAECEPAVVCLGGGTVRYEWNNDAVAGSGPVVLLKVPEEEVVRRVRLADRPRVHADTSLEEDIHIMLEKHWDKYERAADIICDCAGKTLEEEVDELVSLVRNDERFRALLSEKAGSPAEDRGHRR
jgi:shikimate kinase